MTTLVEDLQRHADSLFSKRAMLDSLWQEIAQHFYVERADFTTVRSLGYDLAEGLMTGYPMLVRRDLGNSFHAMLRPYGKAWYKMGVKGILNPKRNSQLWLERAAQTMRRAMYDRESNFVRAAKEGDHDFATFGQAVLMVEPDIETSSLLYRSWHLRDCAWVEGKSQKVDTMYRKWKPTAKILAAKFGTKRLSQSLRDRLEKDPYGDVDCMHAIIPREQEGNRIKGNYLSVYWERDTKHMMEETPVRTFRYVVPRWQTVSGSQYAYSPATVIALPDGRLLQSMTRVLLEAGEKAVDPPMVAVQDVLRSDINVYAGGVTWVDAEYDERLGEALRPMQADRSGLPVGLQMQADVRAMLKEAFFLNRLSPIPPERPQMTAYEVGQHVSEYVRQALPLFEPMETEYNGGLCEETFEQLKMFNTFGDPDDIPEELQDQEVEFKFESPLQQAMDSEKAALLQRSRELIDMAVALDQSAPMVLNAKTALREALVGVGAPSQWLRSEEEVEAMAEQQVQDAEAQKELEAAGQASEMSKNITQSQKQKAEAVR